MRVLICYAILVASILAGGAVGLVAFGLADLFIWAIVGLEEAALDHPIMISCRNGFAIPIGCFAAVGAFGFGMVELASEAAQDESREYTNEQISDHYRERHQS